MFRFEHPDFLYALLLLPLLAGLYWLAGRLRRRDLRKLGDEPTLRRLMPAYSARRQMLRQMLLLGAIAFVVVALTNPQWGTRRENVKRKGVDTFIALDISRSMLATDVPPSRLDRAKRFGQLLIDELAGNRIGLIYFAGNAYLQMPLTTDFAAAQLFLRAASPDLAPTHGTAIGAAIDQALQSFRAGDPQHSKVLIVLTDGESHDAIAPAKADEAAQRGLLIFTVGIGTAQGSFIPLDYGDRQDYLRDQSGNPVLSRLDEPLLRALAQSARGSYYHLDAGAKNILAALKTSIDSIEQRTFEQRAYTDFESYFQYFLAIGILLLGIHFVLPSGKKPLLTNGALHP
jgi:Ca-activated chloride channel family protein